MVQNRDYLSPVGNQQGSLRLALDGHQDQERQNGVLQICHKSILREPSDDLMGRYL